MRDRLSGDASERRSRGRSWAGSAVWMLGVLVLLSACREKDLTPPELAALEQARCESVLSELTKAAETASDAKVRYDLGICKGVLGDHEAARTIFADLIRDHPDYGSAYYGLGTSLGSLARYAESRMALEKARELDDKIPGLFRNLGVAYGELGQISEEREAYSMALDRDPRDWLTRYNLAVSFLLSDPADPREASYLLNEIVEAGMADGATYGNLGVSLLMLGDAREAKKAYRNALGLEPEATKFRFGVGMAAVQLGDIDAARTELEFLKTRDPERARILSSAIEGN